MRYEDTAGPTAERFRHARGTFTIAGKAKSNRKIQMLDDELGRAWMRFKLGGQEYAALSKYRFHWAASGLQGHLNSVDLNRIISFDPAAMSGLAKSEAQVHHRDLYHRAKAELGERPAFVADNIACFDTPLVVVGAILGYRSPYRARTKVLEILADAGYRLERFWHELAKQR